VIYEDLVTHTGGEAQWPEEQQASMEWWIELFCAECMLEIKIAHRGYRDEHGVDHAPVNEGNVTFLWADAEIALGEHIKIWVVTWDQLDHPSAPSLIQRGSHELTYKGRAGTEARIHDSDCDRDGPGNDTDNYEIGQDALGEYLENYFGTGLHGYLKGVISVSSYAPTANEDATWGAVKSLFR
jgi:hypothetical protein